MVIVFGHWRKKCGEIEGLPTKQCQLQREIVRTMQLPKYMRKDVVVAVPPVSAPLNTIETVEESIVLVSALIILLQQNDLGSS